jgi:hypothetical protein
MKITKSQLQNLIKESVKEAVCEQVQVEDETGSSFSEKEAQESKEYLKAEAGMALTRAEETIEHLNAIKYELDSISKKTNKFKNVFNVMRARHKTDELIEILLALKNSI